MSISLVEQENKRRELENKAFCERLMKIKNLPVGRAKKSSGWSPGMARDDSNIPVIDCYNVRYRPEYHYMMKNKRAAREMAAKQIKTENKEIYHRVRKRESDYAPQKNTMCIMPRTFVGTKKQKPLGNPLLPHLDYKPLKQLRDEPSYEISPVSTIPPTRRNNNLPSLNNSNNSNNNNTYSSTDQRSLQSIPSPSSDKSSRPTTQSSTKQNPKNSRPDVDPSITPKSLYCGSYRIDGIDYYINIYELCSNKGKYYFMESIYFQVYDEVSDISASIELSIPEFILSLQSNPALFNKITSYWKKFEKIAPYIKPSISFVLDPGDLYGLCICICDCIDVSIINDEMVLTFVEYDENDYNRNDNNGDEDDIEYIDILEASDHMNRASQTIEPLENDNDNEEEGGFVNEEENKKEKEEEVKEEEKKQDEETVKEELKEQQQIEEEPKKEEEEVKEEQIEENHEEEEEEETKQENKEEEVKQEEQQLENEDNEQEVEQPQEMKQENEDVKEGSKPSEEDDTKQEEINENVEKEDKTPSNEEEKKEEIDGIEHQDIDNNNNNLNDDFENEELTSAELLDIKPQPDNQDNSFDDFK